MGAGKTVTLNGSVRSCQECAVIVAKQQRCILQSKRQLLKPWWGNAGIRGGHLCFGPHAIADVPGHHIFLPGCPPPLLSCDFCDQHLPDMFCCIAGRSNILLLTLSRNVPNSQYCSRAILHEPNELLPANPTSEQDAPLRISDLATAGPKDVVSLRCCAW